MTQQESFVQDLQSQGVPFECKQDNGITEIVVCPGLRSGGEWLATFDSNGNFIQAME